MLQHAQSLLCDDVQKRVIQPKVNFVVTYWTVWIVSSHPEQHCVCDQQHDLSGECYGVQDGWGRWQLGFHALFTLAANCPNLKELTISEEHLEVRPAHLSPLEWCVYLHALHSSLVSNSQVNKTNFCYTSIKQNI